MMIELMPVSSVVINQNPEGNDLQLVESGLLEHLVEEDIVDILTFDEGLDGLDNLLGNNLDVSGDGVNNLVVLLGELVSEHAGGLKSLDFLNGDLTVQKVLEERVEDNGGNLVDSGEGVSLNSSEVLVGVVGLSETVSVESTVQSGSVDVSEEDLAEEIVVVAIDSTVDSSSVDVSEEDLSEEVEVVAVESTGDTSSVDLSEDDLAEELINVSVSIDLLSLNNLAEEFLSVESVSVDLLSLNKLAEDFFGSVSVSEGLWDDSGVGGGDNSAVDLRDDSAAVDFGDQVTVDFRDNQGLFDASHTSVVLEDDWVDILVEQDWVNEELTEDGLGEVLLEVLADQVTLEGRDSQVLLEQRKAQVLLEDWEGEQLAEGVEGDIGGNVVLLSGWQVSSRHVTVKAGHVGLEARNSTSVLSVQVSVADHVEQVTVYSGGDLSAHGGDQHKGNLKCQRVQIKILLRFSVWKF
jgi:hypothetical protein